MHLHADRPLKVHVIAALADRRAELAELAARGARAQTSTRSGVFLQQIRQAGADIIVVDVSGPALADAAIDLVRSLPRGISSVVLLADNPDAAWIRQAVQAGVSGILPRTVTAEALCLAFSAAESGLLLLQPNFASRFGSSGSSGLNGLSHDVETLTAREHEVLKLMSEGLSNKEIAERLQLSGHTVKFHISSILSKLNAGSRTEAVSLGIKKGLLSL